MTRANNYVLSLLLIFVINTVAAQQNSTAPEKCKYNTLLSAYIGQKHGLGSAEFFDNYSKYLGGRNMNMPLSFAFGGNVKIEFIKNMRFGIGGEHFSCNFSDLYRQNEYLNPSDSLPYAHRTVSQQYSFSITPVVLSVEYVPIASLYRTYIGGSAGIAFGSAQWTETIASTDRFDMRTGGQYLNENIVGPAGSIYAGVELAFDRSVQNGNFTFLTLEARYTAIGISKPLFEKVAKQFVAPPDSWKKPVSLGASGITLQIGLAFQFSPQCR